MTWAFPARKPFRREVNQHTQRVLAGDFLSPIGREVNHQNHATSSSRRHSFAMSRRQDVGMRASLCLGAFLTALTLWLPFHWHADEPWYGLCVCLAGWPLPWLAPAQALSLSYDIHVVFLALDLAFWTTFAALLPKLRSDRAPLQLTLIALTLIALLWLCCNSLRVTLPDVAILRHAQPVLGLFPTSERTHHAM